MSSRNKNDLLGIISNLAASFGSPARLKILQLLAQAPRSVQAIADITGESVANTSQHLQRLLAEHLVVVKKEKLTRIYSLKDPKVALLIESLIDVAELVSQEFIEAEKSFQEDASEFLEDLDNAINEIEKRKAFFLDVRERCESDYSRVPGAIPIPYEKLREEAKKLEKGKTYYVFCRGRICELAGKSVKILRSMGFDAYQLRESAVLINEKG